MATITTLIATMQQTEDFEKGVKNGYEMYGEVLTDGDGIQTFLDVWRFLEQEISPSSLELNRMMGRVFDVPALSLPSHVGFLVGYLTHAFTESQE